MSFELSNFFFSTNQRALRTSSPILNVSITDISVQYNIVNGYDVHGCPDTSQQLQSKYYADIKYKLTNDGDADFVAPAESVSYAACGTPAILGFFDLKIEGGIDASNGQAFPIILHRFATCVIDDSDTAAAATCVSGGPSTDFTHLPSQSMVIKKGGSFNLGLRKQCTRSSHSRLRNSML